MKSIFTSTLFLALALAGFSQITVTKSDFITKGDTIRMTQAAIAGVTDPKLTGANYTWDYTNLVPTIQYLDTFVDVANTPFIYQLYFNNGFIFPKNKATIAHKAADLNLLGQVTMTNTFNYYQNITSGYSMVGFGTTINGLPAPTKYDTIDVIYKYPIKYTNKDSSISSFVDSLPGVGYYGQHKKRVNHIEGWGTLQTPFGSFPVLKVKSTLYITDTIYYANFGFGVKFPRPVSYEYKWLGNGKRVPLLEIDAIGNNITNVFYQDSLRANVAHVGIKELMNSHNFKVYPNPASENAMISYSNSEAGSVRVDLLDVSGKLVRNLLDEKQASGEHTTSLNFKNLSIAKGVYFVRLMVSGGTTVQEMPSIQKLVIQ